MTNPLYEQVKREMIALDIDGMLEVEQIGSIMFSFVTLLQRKSFFCSFVQFSLQKRNIIGPGPIGIGVFEHLLLKFGDF